MKNLNYFAVFFLIALSSFSFTKPDKTAFYEALSGQSQKNIDEEILKLNEEKGSAFANAYMGALLMKKANFEKGAGNKVKIFKKGARLLEGAIEANPQNIEYRFLRLTIQEHAPGVLKYNKKLEEDKRLVKDNYDQLEPEIKKIVKKYAADSRVIKLDDLK